jgi:hypothetical protein
MPAAAHDAMTTAERADGDWRAGWVHGLTDAMARDGWVIGRSAAGRLGAAAVGAERGWRVMFIRCERLRCCNPPRKRETKTNGSARRPAGKAVAPGNAISRAPQLIYMKLSD